MRIRTSIFLTLLASFALFGYFSYERGKLNNRLLSVIEETEVLEKSNLELQDRLSGYSARNSETVLDLKLNFLQLKRLGEHTKSCQIRIKGIEEEYGEDLERKVLELVENMGIKIALNDINKAHRLTANKQSKPSPRVTIVELASQKLKKEILRKSSTALANTRYAIQDSVTSHSIPEGFSKVMVANFSEGCGYIASVSEPETRGQAQKLFGAWLQDPVRANESRKEDEIWILPHFYENSVVEEYGSLRDFTRRKKKAVYKLPYEWAGTGHVVYNKTLYFIPFNSSRIVRYDFNTKSVLAERRIPGALYSNNAPYQWAGSTDIDLSSDVDGLWAIYATLENTLDIVISRIDPITLRVIHTWKTNWRKQWSGNAFMMCGVLYVLKRYDERNSALSYIYDTRLKRHKRVNIPFTNRYEWNSMLEFNFRQKQICAWDRGYLVTYDVKLSEQIP